MDNYAACKQVSSIAHQGESPGCCTTCYTVTAFYDDKHRVKQSSPGKLIMKATAGFTTVCTVNARMPATITSTSSVKQSSPGKFIMKSPGFCTTLCTVMPLACSSSGLIRTVCSYNDTVRASQCGGISRQHTLKVQSHSESELVGGLLHRLCTSSGLISTACQCNPTV